MSGLVLFDDAQADRWAPFALTRPCGELRYGRWTLRERVERLAGSSVTGHVTRPWLRSYAEAGAPPALNPEALAEEGGATDGGFSCWNSRAVADVGAAWGGTPANLWIAGQFAGLTLPPGAALPSADWYAAPAPRADLADREISGEWLAHPWDLVSGGTARLRADLEADLSAGGHGSLDGSGSSDGTGSSGGGDVHAGVARARRQPLAGGQGSAGGGDAYDGRAVPEGCWQLGEGALRLAAGVRVEPGVVFDTREGPIELDAGVEVRAGTRLQGPLYAGPGSRLLGGAIARFSGGPYSFVRGEVDSVTSLGHFNKAHEGFLGHAYVGRWVNLGASTVCSDLKHTYGTVRVGPPDGRRDTGLIKLGCLLGDFVKAGIGTRLPAGALVGAGSSLFDALDVPGWVAPFSWGGGGEPGRCHRDGFLTAAGRAMARRGVELDARARNWLGDVWDRAAGA